MVGRVGAYACRLFAVFNKAIRSGVPRVELGRLSSLLLGLVQVCTLAFRVLVPAVLKQRQHFIRGFLFNFFNVNFQKEFFFIVQHFYIFVLQIKKIFQVMKFFLKTQSMNTSLPASSSCSKILSGSKWKISPLLSLLGGDGLVLRWVLRFFRWLFGEKRKKIISRNELEWIDEAMMMKVRLDGTGCWEERKRWN